MLMKPAEKPCKFKDILSHDDIRDRWRRVKRYFFLRESTFDMTRRCNIRCEGCYFYAGAKQHVADETDERQWRRLMQAEKARGITFVVLAGAEPSLASHLCRCCHDVIDLGCIATNGIQPIADDIGYRIHISVWGDDATSQRIRGAKHMLQRQIDNYAGDPRAVFVYTFTRQNIDQIGPVMDELAKHDCRATFNMFSATADYHGSLRHDTQSLIATRQAMLEMMGRYPSHVLFSPYSAVVHTYPIGLHALFDCPYPRRNPSTAVGLGRSFRQYRADLTWNRQAACCVPDTDCADCRHYAAGSAVVTSRMMRHATSPELFRAWLDYVDTYLAVWVNGYAKGRNLSDRLTSPPERGHRQGHRS